MPKKIITKREVEYVKVKENVNLVKLSTAYDTNCSEEEFTEVDDKTLNYILQYEQFVTSQDSYSSNKELSVSYDDSSGKILNNAKCCYEEDFFSDDKKQAEVVLEIFSSLSDKQRKRLYMKYKLKMSYIKIGKIEGKAPSTIMESCNRALKKLQKHGKYLSKLDIKMWVDLLI